MYIESLILLLLCHFLGNILVYNPDHRFHNGTHSPIIEGILSLIAIFLFLIRMIIFIYLFFINSLAWYDPILIHAAAYGLSAFFFLPTVITIAARNWVTMLIAQLISAIAGIATFIYSIFWLISL